MDEKLKPLVSGVVEDGVLACALVALGWEVGIEANGDCSGRAEGTTCDSEKESIAIGTVTERQLSSNVLEMDHVREMAGTDLPFCKTGEEAADESSV